MVQEVLVTGTELLRLKSVSRELSGIVLKFFLLDVVCMKRRLMQVRWWTLDVMMALHVWRLV